MDDCAAVSVDLEVASKVSPPNSTDTEAEDCPIEYHKPEPITMRVCCVCIYVCIYVYIIYVYIIKL